MSKDLESKTKKELVEIIIQLKDKLGEMVGVEAKQGALEDNLRGLGFSVVQDLNGKFNLVEIMFDYDTKAAKLHSSREIHPSNYEFSLFEAKKFLVEKIMSKDNLNHLKGEKNG